MKAASTVPRGAKVRQFKRRLEASRDEVLRFLNRVGREAQMTNVNYVQDLGDLSIMNVSTEDLFQRGSQKRQQLQMIEAALARIEDGSFGQVRRLWGSNR